MADADGDEKRRVRASLVVARRFLHNARSGMAKAVSKSARRRIRSARELIDDAKTKITEISCTAAKRRLDDRDSSPLLVDVREEFEHDIARLGDSVHISRGTLEMLIDQEYPDRDREILLYCARGDRSALAALTLERMGYRRVASIEGGLHAWRESGLPVVIPSEQRGPGSGI